MYLGGLFMGLFSKKQKINYEQLFKDKYKSINQLTMQANDELDFQIKESLYDLIVKEYDELLSYIEQGANFDKEHFLSLKENAKQQLETIHNINKNEL